MSEFPDIVIEAYNRLLQHRIVEISLPIQANLSEGKTGWEFKCVAKVPYPNTGKVPREVILHVLIPETFPMEPVEFYPENVKAFPHQDAETGKLCLPEESLAPLNASGSFATSNGPSNGSKTQQTKGFYNPVNLMNYPTLAGNF